MTRFLFSSPFPISILVLIIVIPVFTIGCKSKQNTPPLFDSLSPDRTGIDFINELEERPGNNILESEFFYNGGGVAVGDINNDNLPDIYFTANHGKNGLYQNLGDFNFRNITLEAGVSDSTGWSAGTTMADINGDGLLDIYVCKAGKEQVENRRNKLFLNNGDLTFTEKANEFGLDDPGYCTQASFFDYNGDGLLDVYIVNYNVRVFTRFDIQTIRDEIDPYAGDKLYRNNGDGTFTDVSIEAGIKQNPLGFGLSATVSDLNSDGRPDIYVANDYMERDYMYINQGDGTFRDEILERTDVTSYFSMGSDIADINNNSLPDILVVDMLPPDYTRRRKFKHPDPAIYDHLAASGYHRKNMRNTLQINNGNGIFTEAGQLAGISMTDWSWSALIADFENDGFQDIYITNGFPRFYTDLDFLNNILWKQYPDEDLPDDPQLRYNLVRQMEEVEMHNYAFRNNGDLSFSDSTETWGLKASTVSGGAAYADLNNNGTLDLVVNNINKPPHIYKNNAPELNGNNWLKIRLIGSDNNTFGTGSKIVLTGDDGAVYFREAFTTRGFQSSTEPVLLFGLGDLDTVHLSITWPDQSQQTFDDVEVNQTLTLHQHLAEINNTIDDSQESNQNKMFVQLDETALGLDFKHEKEFSQDKITTPLLPHTLSNLGPALAIGDINNDGLEDLFIGGGYDQPGQLFLQQSNGSFTRIESNILNEHRAFYDVDALFFDSNGNGHLDLYLVSGGNSHLLNGPEYQDRLYINDGLGNFSWAENSLPEMHSSGGTVTLIDIENDGEPDLFVGGRSYTGRYPMPPRSYLLENDNGQFKDVTEEIAPDLMNPGLVTSSAWADINGDGNDELIIAGEWMPIRIFRNNGTRRFTEMTREAGLDQTSGWWNVIKVADLNNDGYTDIIGGNWGLNSPYRATPENPFLLYLDDFNEDAFYDPIMSQVFDGKRYPVPGRDLLLQQIPGLEDKFPDYASYADAAIHDILSERQIRNATVFEVHTFESTLFKNDGRGRFDPAVLPHSAQIAPVYDIFVDDFYMDGTADLLFAGNNSGTRPETGPVTAQGIMLKGLGDYNYKHLLPVETGLYAAGDIRNINLVPTAAGPLFLFARNDDTILPYLYNSPISPSE